MVTSDPITKSIFISGYSETTTAADLHDLFAKLVQVQSVFEPPRTPTGLRRKFFILKVTGDDGDVAKCIKKLNNCLWKGGTLNVEAANEHYDERIRREKAELQEKQEKLLLQIEEEVAKVMPTFEEDHLRLKRAIGERGVGQHVYVSTAQLMRKSNQQAYIIRGNNKNEVMSCGRRVLFEEDEEGNVTERAVDAWGNDIDFNDEADREKEVKGEQGGSSSGDGTAEDLMMGDGISSGENNNDAAAAAAAGAGAGVRRGFGTLLPQLKVAKASTKESAAVFQAVMDDADSHFAPANNGSRYAQMAGSGGGRDVNDLIQENEFMEEDMIEIVKDASKEEVHIPSATAEELEDAELAKVRSNALAVAAMLLGNSAAAAAGGGGGGAEDGTINNTNNSSNKGGDPYRERQFKSGWDATTIAHYDPSNEETAGQFLMDAAESEEVIQRARQRREEKEQAQREKEREKRREHGWAEGEDEQQQYGHGSGSARTEEATSANLDQLKSIFQKEDGGVWFGDTGTDLKTEAGKGDALTDRIFLEAEKFGFDVRDNGGDNGDKGGKGGMTFGFFDTPADTTAATTSSSSIGDGGGDDTSTTPAPSQQQVAPTTMSVSDATAAAAEYAPLPSPEPMDVVASGGAVCCVLDLSDVVRQAKRFCRDESKQETELVQSWRNNKDKLVADYKRRKKDAKRRSDRYNLNHHRPTHVERGGTPQQQERKKGRGGKKHRKVAK